MGIALGEPMYVTHINPKSNTVTLGLKEDLQSQSVLVRNVNFGKYSAVTDGFEALSKIRYKDKGSISELHNEKGKIRIDFREKVYGVAPGQSAVFYEGDDLLGGGFICRED